MYPLLGGHLSLSHVCPSIPCQCLWAIAEGHLDLPSRSFCSPLGFFQILLGHAKICSCWTRRNSLGWHRALCSLDATLKHEVLVLLLLSHAIAWGPLQNWSGPSLWTYHFIISKVQLSLRKTTLSLNHYLPTTYLEFLSVNSILNKHNWGSQSKHGLLFFSCYFFKMNRRRGVGIPLPLDKT